MKFTDIFTENDNATFCAMRIMGFIGLGIVATAVVISAAPLEAGAGVAAVIASVGGSIRLKNGEAIDTKE